ncbi:hypothetical protein EDB84DRAFT_1680202, partial [Lactarius hengduanensis]
MMGRGGWWLTKTSHTPRNTLDQTTKVESLGEVVVVVQAHVRWHVVFKTKVKKPENWRREAVNWKLRRTGFSISGVPAQFNLSEWHGFTYPCGFGPGVWAGTGTGTEFVTLTKPVPVVTGYGFRRARKSPDRTLLQRFNQRCLHLAARRPVAATSTFGLQVPTPPSYGAQELPCPIATLRHRRGMRASPRRYDSDTASQRHDCDAVPHATTATRCRNVTTATRYRNATTAMRRRNATIA